MIGVIADDLTGAAEVAGAAFAAGLSAEVWTAESGVPGESAFGAAGWSSGGADVVVLDTDTRWRSPEEAGSRVEHAADALRRERPERVFKKVDSLLRGHVVREVEVVRRAFGLSSTLLVPAHPAIGRTIERGRYYIYGVPLHESPLARDPGHPRPSSCVDRLLGARAGTPIRLPDATSVNDLRRLASELDPDTLAAGSAAFFEAILFGRAESAREEAGGRKPGRVDVAPTGPSLFVCGSLSAWRDGRAGEAARYDVPVFRLPDEMLVENGDLKAARADFRRDVEARRDGGSALIAIGRSTEVEGVAPEVLVGRLAEAAVGLAPAFRSVYLEGGATAAAFLKQMAWTHLRVAGVVAPGVVTMTPVDATTPIYVTTKSGSYPWPDRVWDRESEAGPPRARWLRREDP
ncbi:MAG: four-carbon acid sugar kinase family protein [Rhodothermales bacterium]